MAHSASYEYNLLITEYSLNFIFYMNAYRNILKQCKYENLGIFVFIGN